MVPRDDMREQPPRRWRQTLARPDGTGRGVIGMLGRVAQPRLEVRPIFSKVMQTPRKPREGFCSEASSALLGTVFHFSQVPG